MIKPVRIKAFRIDWHNDAGDMYSVELGVNGVTEIRRCARSEQSSDVAVVHCGDMCVREFNLALMPDFTFELEEFPS